MRQKNHRAKRLITLLIGLIGFGYAAYLILQFTGQDDDDIFAFISYGSELQSFVPAVTTAKVLRKINVTDQVMLNFQKLTSRLQTMCNAPFSSSLRTASYTNQTLEHLSSIVIITPGYHAPTAATKKKLPFLQKLKKEFDCDYTRAADEFFTDDLFADFVNQLRKMTAKNEKLRREFGIGAKSKSAAVCSDGQITAYGIAQNLMIGLKLAAAFGNADEARNYFKTAFSSPSKENVLRITTQRSEANALGILATLFGLSKAMGIEVTLAELARMEIATSENANFCELAQSVGDNPGFNANSCQCDDVRIVKKIIRSHFKESFLLHIASDKGAKLRSDYFEIIDRFGLPHSEPQRIVDVAMSILPPICSVSKSLVCKVNTTDEITDCLLYNDVEQIFATYSLLPYFFDGRMNTKISTLRMLPFGSYLIAKLAELVNLAKLHQFIPPVEIFSTNEEALGDLIRMLRFPIGLYQPRASVSPGSGLSLDLFRSQEKKYFVRLVDLDSGLPLMLRSFCQQTYAAMCEFDAFLRGISQLAAGNLDIADYQRACNAYSSLLK